MSRSIRMTVSGFSPWVRGVTLLLALGVSLLLLIYPHMLGRELTTVDHSLLPFFLAADGAAFAFGLGFSFRSPFMQILTSPYIVWPVLGLCLFAMIRF